MYFVEHDSCITNSIVLLLFLLELVKLYCAASLNIVPLAVNG